MTNPIIFILGYKIFSFNVSDAPSILNLCMDNGIIYRKPQSREDKFYFECSLLTAKKLEKLCSEQDVDYETKEGGIPKLLGKYRHRYGIFAGLFLSLLLFLLTNGLIWDIRIDGARHMTEAEVLEELNACGLRIGTPIKEIEADILQNRVLIYSDNISWISINLSGTVAHVEIREAAPLPEQVEEPEATNLIATRDGQIEGFEEVRGNIAVKIGDLVREGDLLVGGIYDSASLGFTYTRAKGKVYARVEDNIEIEIPLSYDKKVYTGEVFSEKYLVFFDKEIKFYSNSGNLHTTCDTIDTVEYFSVFSGSELPFGIRTVKHLEYRYESAQRDAEEAVELALYKLRCIEEEKGITDVISKSFSGEFFDDKYLLRCTSVSICNIAKETEIDISRERKT